MALHTNLKGRKRNTKLYPKDALLPLFEAVVNSIEAIEEAKIPMYQGSVRIDILRHGTEPLPLDADIPEKAIWGFKVTDNGVGFNDDNFTSFETLDTDYKLSKGCRGVGRLLWLKAFRKISVDSVFEEAGCFKKRTFIFDENGVNELESVRPSDEKAACTLIYLEDFFERYRHHAPATAEKIAEALFEHCLWYFIQPGGAPHIVLNDGETTILLDEIYERNILTNLDSEIVRLKEQKFELTHVKLRHSTTPPKLFYCAAHRPVKSTNLKDKIAGLFGRISSSDDGDFNYICHVSSDFFDERVASDRTDFDIAEEIDSFLSEVELSFKEIDGAIIRQISIYLEKYLETNKQAGRERIRNFVDNQAPQYRPLLDNIDDGDLIIPPDCKDSDLELALHKKKAALEAELLTKGHEILISNDYGDDYEKAVDEYLSKANILKKSDLAAYVAHRWRVLSLLGKLLEANVGGKYVDEKMIHRLIMPMGKTSDEVSSDIANLWIIDEKLAFHHYLASDKALKSMPITGSESGKEPDVIALSVFDRPTLVSESHSLPLAAITVIELKKPMRNNANDEDKNPLSQILGYLNQIREGKVLTRNGRPIPQSENIPGFCYVVCDLTSSVVTQCKNFNLNPTADQCGYFGYNSNYKTYIEVLSYDKLIEDAKKRNRAFFTKLGLP